MFNDHFKIFIKRAQSLKFYFINNIHINKYDKHYIRTNKIKWTTSRNLKKDREKKILVDLFDWKPFIHFWSYLTNLLSIFYKAEIKFFYFNHHDTFFSRTRLFTYKLEKIYNSFNASKGIYNYSFKYNKYEKLKFEKQFNKFAKSKKKLLSYKKNNVLIGDLIYDSYLKEYSKPTLDLNDEKLKTIFFKAEKIYQDSKLFFLRYDVKCVIPSHVCYISYGIIARLALNKKIPVITIRAENRGNSTFKFLKMDNNCVNEVPYYNFKKTFLSFSKLQKRQGISIGKKLFKLRVSGKFDKNIPYMSTNPFNRKLKITNKIKKNISKKNKIIIFPHCYLDNPHRYRKMIFDDFYDQVNYFLELSKTMDNYEWYYKPHPNELDGNLNIHRDILKKFKNVKYLKKNTGHIDITKLNPKCVITNHGTIAHEYAMFKIPVINTGDNPHINYNFCLHVKSKKELNKVMNNLDHYIKKIDFNKQEIYEYLFMKYKYFPYKNNEDIYLKNDNFNFKNVKKNNTSLILKKFSKQSGNVDINIKNYINEFIRNHL